MTEPKITVFPVRQGGTWGVNVVLAGATVGEARYDFATRKDAWNWGLEAFLVLTAQERAGVTLGPSPPDESA